MKSLLFIALLVLVASAINDCKKSGEDKGDDSKCIAPNGTTGLFCCVYSKVEFLGVEAESWTCGLAPAENADDSVEVAGISGEYYCDNAFLMKVSFVVAAVVSLFAF